MKGFFLEKRKKSIKQCFKALSKNLLTFFILHDKIILSNFAFFNNS